jgi:hypothetical protein
MGMDPSKIHERTREQLEALPPEKRAKAEAVLAKIQSPEYRAGERAEREALDKELRETGRIALRGGAVLRPDWSGTPRGLVEDLVRARTAAGISMGEVARRSGIDLAALSRLENGIQANDTMATIQRYARAIGKRVAWRLEDTS